MSNELRNELIALGLASYVFRDTDGMRSTAIRTNDEAADLVLAFVARRLAEAKEAAWDVGYVSGHSRAMRQMSDEPGLAPGVNPYWSRP